MTRVLCSGCGFAFDSSITTGTPDGVIVLPECHAEGPQPATFCSCICHRGECGDGNHFGTESRPTLGRRGGL